MLNVYICENCGLVQLKNPAKIKQQLKKGTDSVLECPKCNGNVVKADVSYVDYAYMSEDEREILVQRYTGQETITIFLTGANGQLGRALNEVINKMNAAGGHYKIINTSRSISYIGGIGVRKLDITCEADVQNAIHHARPDVIINCAAHTGVDQCETEETQAYAVNALAPKYLAEAARAVDAVFVHVSTDYVFSGEKEDAYTENDETGPKSAYGRTKLAGEKFVQETGGKYFIVRTAWLYGDGKNFVKTMLRQAEERESVSVVCDQRGTPTSSHELAKAIMFLTGRKEYGIYHATCEGETTWYEFARKIFELSGKQMEVIPVTSENYQAVAVRPKNSVLENKKLKELSYDMKDWESALKDYLI